MFLEYPLNTCIEEELLLINPDDRDYILRLFAAYERLLRVAERDRACLAAVLDEIGVRLDQVHPTPEMPPEAAREVVMKALRRHVAERQEATSRAVKDLSYYGAYRDD